MFLIIYNQIFGTVILNINELGKDTNIQSASRNEAIFYNQRNRYPLINGVEVSDTFSKSGEVTVPIENRRSVLPQILYSPKQLLTAYSNPSYVKELINSNKNVSEILKANNLNEIIYPENILNISNSHIMTTTACALNIANKMGLSSSDKKILETASIFHDFGKILIPTELLNKPSELTEDERKIVDLHSVLGYELLYSSGMNERILELIKNHHNPMSKNPDILGQILSVADIYSALREERSYKSSMSEKEAISLLDQKAKSGEVSTEVVNALKASIMSEYKA